MVTRGRGRAAWVAITLAVTAGVAGCTGARDAPVPPVPTGSLRDGSVTAAPTAPAEPTPAPSLTPIDTLRCAREVQRPGPGPLPASVLQDAVPAVRWGGGLAGAVETVPGPDAGRCAPGLPAVRCADRPPWLYPPTTDLFTASGATRALRGQVTGQVRRTTSAGATVLDLQSATWASLTLAPADAAKAATYLRSTVERCADGSPQTLRGRRVDVGIAPSQYRQGPATVVVLTGPSAVGWLVLDGTTALSTSELARLVAAAAPRLVPTR
ncbi:hypothetical protein [Terracoccus luteus]|uniref:PknH-like protein n=1 Tax=Terracoccus luteus TaxID=53356 RepID=A0A839PUU7_9MICO|nr:hypothetical protein [Terracoccus luteus]MBB2987297.1 hypothetical protein [Terracoccus luteus]MCP2172948.1 hypothetical protein [Terracoccus luteus]